MDIKRTLADLGVIPRKARGQNFLTDEGMAQAIVDAASISEDDPVIEIGPGLGVLTDKLLGKTKRLAVVEIEEEFCRYLAKRYPSLSPSRIYNSDVRKLDLNLILKELEAEEATVVSNVPYSISSDIILWVINNHRVVRHASLLLQKEFAARIAAHPGKKDYGSLTVLRTLYAEAECNLLVPGSKFHPPARVDSALVVMSLSKEALIPIGDEVLFTKVVRGAFSQRRKTLVNSLSGSKLLENKQAVLELLESLKIDPRRRAETLSVSEFASVALAIQQAKSVQK